MSILEEEGLEEEKERKEGGRMTFLSPHAGRPSRPSVCLGDDLPYPSQVTAKMLSQQHPDIPSVFTIAGFEEPLCQFEIQNRLWFCVPSASPQA